MRKQPSLILFLLLLLFFLSQCIRDNIEEKYAPKSITDSLIGEIAWFPLNGNLNDSTGNSTIISVAGEVRYISGISKEYGEGIQLNGTNNYITITPGFLDTISILFWLKTPNGISKPNQPVVFDYGNNAISASLVDGLTGATDLLLQNNENSKSSSDLGEENFLNTFNNYCLFYIEAGGDSTSFTYKGYLSNGNEKIVSGHYKFPGFIDPATEVIYIGRSSLRTEITNSLLNGSIDEIHVFNRFLTKAELAYYLSIQPD